MTQCANCGDETGIGAGNGCYECAERRCDGCGSMTFVAHASVEETGDEYRLYCKSCADEGGDR
jgi:hypothetical protein